MNLALQFFYMAASMPCTHISVLEYTPTTVSASIHLWEATPKLVDQIFRFKRIDLSNGPHIKVPKILKTTPGTHLGTLQHRTSMELSPRASISVEQLQKSRIKFVCSTSNHVQCQILTLSYLPRSASKSSRWRSRPTVSEDLFGKVCDGRFVSEEPTGNCICRASCALLGCVLDEVMDPVTRITCLGCHGSATLLPRPLIGFTSVSQSSMSRHVPRYHHNYPLMVVGLHRERRAFEYDTPWSSGCTHVSFHRISEPFPFPPRDTSSWQPLIVYPPLAVDQCYLFRSHTCRTRLG